MILTAVFLALAIPVMIRSALNAPLDSSMVVVRMKAYRADLGHSSTS
jgi:hypothetical protein